jgi:phosphatidylglycerophosphate synthase
VGSIQSVRCLDQLEGLPEDGSVLLVRGDYLFDNRILHRLCEVENTALRLTDRPGEPLVAARVENVMADQVLAAFDGGVGLDEALNIKLIEADELVSPVQAELRKFEPARIYPLTQENRGTLERHLFGGAYKGVTDLVTKWVWPTPARWGVRTCISLGLSPNQVTALNWVLVVITTVLFSAGHFGWGLLTGWFMTYLDTVDGKLARVSVASSRFGHFADHILDLIHPPFWYLAWGMALASYEPSLLPLSLDAALRIIFVFYILGRLCEGGFELWLGRFGIFCWRPMDSFSRLVTARRNPCLLLLTAGALIGRPDVGLEAVAVWTLLSTLFLLVRLAMATFQRLQSGPLTSWLAEVDRGVAKPSLAERCFSRPELAGLGSPTNRVEGKTVD